MGIKVVISFPERRRMLRVKHEVELPPELRTTPPSRPEVRQGFPQNLFVPFGRHYQLTSKEMNPLLTPNNWTQGYDHKLWVANDNGFGNRDKPRRNYVTGENMTADLPKVEVLTCGGNLLAYVGETEVKFGRTWEPGYLVETIPYKVLYGADYILANRHLQTWAVDLTGDGLPSRFPQGRQDNGYLPGFVHPFLGTGTIAFPKWRLEDWTRPELPDVYAVYSPA